MTRTPVNMGRPPRSASPTNAGPQRLCVNCARIIRSNRWSRATHRDSSDTWGKIGLVPIRPQPAPNIAGNRTPSQRRPGRRLNQCSGVAAQQADDWRLLRAVLDVNIPAAELSPVHTDRPSGLLVDDPFMDLWHSKSAGAPCPCFALPATATRRGNDGTPKCRVY